MSELEQGLSRPLSRRDFLRTGAAVGGGLVVGFLWPTLGCASAAPASPSAAAKPAAHMPNAFVRIATDGQVTVLVPKSEMGQGVLTSLAMIVAEELDVDWKHVRSEEAPADKPYRIGFLGQMTAGSDSVRGGWDPLRKAGATARQMLVEAAADRWGVSAATCHTERGEVVHGASGRRLGYGALAEAAAKRWTPWRVALKDPKAYKIVGQRHARLDTPAKVDGSAIYGLDVRLPGMLTACVARCPVFGGKVASFDAKPALAVPGVRHVLAITGGVAVVADHYWAARKGVEALVVHWDEGRNAKNSTAFQRESYRKLVEGRGRQIAATGDVDKALAGAAKRVEAIYETPYLAHATMEPQNCTAVVGKGTCEVWVGTQAQTATQEAAGKAAGVSADKVVVHTTFLGGGFGRRAEIDFVVEAVELAKATGKPVKVVWSRPDDMRHDFYRPASTHKFVGGLDAEGWPVAWKHHVAASSIMARVMPIVTWITNDPITLMGLDEDFAYAPADMRIELTNAEAPVPVGFWRSVGYSHNVYALEHFLDELAHLGGKDPLAVRRRLLADRPRLRAVLDLAAAKFGWDKPLRKGRHKGLAISSCFGSHIAQVAEISLNGNELQVHRVVSAVDCGQVINPAIIEAQIEGGIVYGLTAALHGAITIADGRVEQGNFDGYPMLRMHEMPQVETHIVINGERPGGIGEVGVPCVAPAIANAILAATGKPVRQLPIKL